jgi:hypothetical protein
VQGTHAEGNILLETLEKSNMRIAFIKESKKNSKVAKI